MTGSTSTVETVTGGGCIAGEVAGDHLVAEQVEADDAADDHDEQHDGQDQSPDHPFPAPQFKRIPPHRRVSPAAFTPTASDCRPGRKVNPGQRGFRSRTCHCALSRQKCRLSLTLKPALLKWIVRRSRLGTCDAAFGARATRSPATGARGATGGANFPDGAKGLREFAGGTTHVHPMYNACTD